MQEHTPLTEFYQIRSPKRVQALKGQENFIQLLRTRPLASWQSNKVYALFAGQLSETNHTNANGSIQLGQIVPKKLFPLAVDRNRVRRIARAQAQALAKTINGVEPIQLLLKLSPAKKSPGAARSAQATPTQNPHTQAFSDALRASMAQAVQRISSTCATHEAIQ